MINENFQPEVSRYERIGKFIDVTAEITFHFPTDESAPMKTTVETKGRRVISEPTMNLRLKRAETASGRVTLQQEFEVTTEYDAGLSDGKWSTSQTTTEWRDIPII